jgi:hypothetical protein
MRSYYTKQKQKGMNVMNRGGGTEHTLLFLLILLWRVNTNTKNEATGNNLLRPLTFDLIIIIRSRA